MSKTDKESINENEDQSMEEILQSIRRIITEDDAEDSDDNNLSSKSSLAPIGVSDSDEIEIVDGLEDEPLNTEFDDIGTDEEDDQESDILELTEIIGDNLDTEDYDSDVNELDNNHDTMAKTESAELTNSDVEALIKNKSDDTDVLQNIDGVLGVKSDSESLLSNSTAKATSALLNKVRKTTQTETQSHTGISTRGGITVEDLMIEAMRPMLKTWLDENLPSLVERIVQKEIQKLSGN